MIKKGLIETDNGEFLRIHDFFNQKVLPKFIKLLKDTSIQLILIPSLSDICFDYVYPQPDFHKAIKVKEFDEYNDRFYCFSNPCIFSINDITIGISTNDILFNLVSESCQKIDKLSISRIARSSEELINQQSFYPLYPGGSDSQIDLPHYNYLTMKCQPDILFLSSKLQRIIHVYNGSIIINSSSLTKGNSGGLYTKITIQPNKIEKDIKQLPSMICNRAKVTIQKI